MPKIIDHLCDYSFVLLEKHENSQQSFLFDENPSLVNKNNYFQKLPFSTEKRKIKNPVAQNGEFVVSIKKCNSLSPIFRMKKCTLFWQHFVVNNFSRTIYKVGVFWRKNSNLGKKKGKFYKQFKIGSFFNFFRK